MNLLVGDTGIIFVFGICTAVVMIMAIRLRVLRHAVLASAATGLLCGMLIYAIIATVSLLTGGTGGYQLATWLVVVLIGAIPAGAVGLVEGVIASVIVRQFDRGRL